MIKKETRLQRLEVAIRYLALAPWKMKNVMMCHIKLVVVTSGGMKKEG